MKAQYKYMMFLANQCWQAMNLGFEKSKKVGCSDGLWLTWPWNNNKMVRVFESLCIGHGDIPWLHARRIAWLWYSTMSVFGRLWDGLGRRNPPAFRWCESPLITVSNMYVLSGDMRKGQFVELCARMLHKMDNTVWIYFLYSAKNYAWLVGYPRNNSRNNHSSRITWVTITERVSNKDNYTHAKKRALSSDSETPPRSWGSVIWNSCPNETGTVLAASEW